MFIKIICLLLLFSNYYIEYEIKEISKEKLEEINYYLEIEKYNIVLPILYGTTNDILDQNVVGIMETFNNLEENKNTVLAAHNYENLFKELYYLNIGDTINIIGKEIVKYEVIKKDIIEETDMSYFFQGSESQLTLITCYGYNKRLIVITQPIN